MTMKRQEPRARVMVRVGQRFLTEMKRQDPSIIATDPDQP